MEIEVEVTIDGSVEAVWRVITDIEHASNTISGIEDVEVLDKPTDGLVGLKWVETRTLFGKQATETMWITEAVENDYYKTRAESHGAVYSTVLSVAPAGDQTRLTMSFGGEPQTLTAKVMSAIMSPFFKKATRDALAQDLEDIKAAVEQGK